jgi:hypothetical protein
VTQVVVVEFDEALRGVLRDILTTIDHYAVTELTTEEAALTHLVAIPESVVALCSNTHADHHLSTAFFAAVVADKRLRMRHRYLLLSTNPARIPATLRVDLKQLGAPILSKPFDMDVLLATVAEAARRLTPTGPQGLLMRLEATGQAVRSWLLATTARLR